MVQQVSMPIRGRAREAPTIHLAWPRRLLMTVAFLIGAAGDVSAQVDYRRAEAMLGWNAERLVTRAVVAPQWLEDGDRFWYRVDVADGAEFVLVDPVRNTRRPVFDNGRLAAAMSMANDTTYSHTMLPFRTFEFVNGERDIEFRADSTLFRCDVVDYVCTVGEAPAERPASHVPSPDGRWEAFIHEHNLHVRPTGGGDSIQVTTDGVEYWGYGLRAPRPNDIISGEPREPTLHWSPDSRKIAVLRVDEREVEHMPLYSSTSRRPRGFTYPYALPGDSIIPRPSVHVIDVESEANIRIALDPAPAFISLGGATDSVWNAASDRIHFTTGTRGWKSVQLVEADASTGAVRVLAANSRTTFVELGQRSPANWYVADTTDDVIWFSQRDGWAHLYRYDRRNPPTVLAGDSGEPRFGFGGNGAAVNRITSGTWTVGEIKYVDEGARRVYFLARGTDASTNPYHAQLYRVGFNGSGLELLTPEDADHSIAFSPSGRYFVDTYSRVDRPPVTVLRSADDGSVIHELERADVTRLLEIGWTYPQPFKVKARDGVTDIYGVMYKPSTFDSTKSYPIIWNIYPGPQIGSVRTWSFEVARRQDPHAMAELGFIVLQIDHMGTPFRSKAFHDTWYGNMGDNGIPDYISAMHQLAARHAFIDLDRVGIYGHSGGGFASTDAILRYPEHFHVAVSRAGNHDNRSYSYTWGEKYQGLMEVDPASGRDNYENQVNFMLAENLEGKLLLMHGDMDDNVHPAMTLRLVDALIEANKDFDMLILPDRPHSLREPYVKRREWDYFVRHLLQEEPPAIYRIAPPPEGN